MKVNPTEPIDVAIVVKKQSGTGIFKNERLLLIKSGFVSYFSRIPKHYVGNVRSLQLSGELPKMTLCATDIVAIQRKVKYLHMKFNKKHLINMEKLKKLVQGDKNQQQISGSQMEEWVFKCQNTQESQMFIKQVLSYKNNPEFKPKIQNFVQGYKSGKKGFHPESIKTPVITPAHRYSERPQTLVKKVRTNTVCEKPSDDHRNLFILQEKKQKQPQQAEVIQENQEEKEQQEQLPIKKLEDQQLPIKNQPKDSKEPKEPKETPPPPKMNQEQINSYSKQMFPYYPFVKVKTNFKKQLSKEIDFGKNFKQDKSLLEKLKNNSMKNTKKQLLKKEKSPKIVPKRSATFDSKKDIAEQKQVKPNNSSSVNRSSSWSELKKLKRAYSLIGSLRKDSKVSQQGMQQRPEEKYEEELYQPKHQQKLVVDENNQSEFGPPTQQPSMQSSMFILEQKSMERNLDETQVDNITKQGELHNEDINFQQNNLNESNILENLQKMTSQKQNAQNKKQDVVILTNSQQKEEIIEQIAETEQVQAIQISQKIVHQVVQIQQTKSNKIDNLQKDEQKLRQQQSPPQEQKIVNIIEQKISHEIQLKKQENEQIIINQIKETNYLDQVKASKLQYQANQYYNDLSKEIKQLEDIETKQVQLPSLESNIAQIDVKDPIKIQDNHFQDQISSKVNIVAKQQSPPQIMKIMNAETINQHIQQVEIKSEISQVVKIEQTTKTEMQKQIKLEEKKHEKIQIQVEVPIQVQSEYPQSAQEQKNQQQQQHEQSQQKSPIQVQEPQKQQLIKLQVQQEVEPQIKQEEKSEILIINEEVLGKTKQQLKITSYSEIIIEDENDDEEFEYQKSGEEILIIQDSETNGVQGIQIQLIPETYENINRYAEDAISFKNLQIINQEGNQIILTPRFWEDEELPSPIIQNTQNENINKEKRKAYQKLIESGQKQRQKIKSSEIEQIEKQTTSYTHHLLDITKNDGISETMRKIANKFKSPKMQQIPTPIALELLSIRNKNNYQTKAIDMMISFVDRHYCEEGVDCESIMFGKRIKCQGWSLYQCRGEQVYIQLFQLYQRLYYECALHTAKYRPPKLCGLKYKGHFGIYLQQPQPINLNLPKNIINILYKVLGKQLYQQIKSQIILGQDRQTNQLIIYFSPDYLHLQIKPQREQKRDVVELGLDEIENIVQYAWEEYVCSSSQEEADKSKKMQTMQIVFQSYHLTLKHSPTNKIQINQTCKLQQPTTPTTTYQIDRIFSNLITNLSTQNIFKAVQILYWKALKLLALSDLHQQQYTDICDYLAILSTAAQLYVKQGKYLFALQICMYDLEVLVGQDYVRDLVGTQRKISETKLYLMLKLDNDEEITKICEFLSINLILSLQCQSKIQNKENQQIHELYSTIIAIMNEALSITTNIFGEHNKPILKLAENHAYYSIILNELYYQFLVLIKEVRREDVMERIFLCKQKSYQYAQVLLKISSPQMKKKQISPFIVINYIDFLISEHKYQEALKTIETSLVQLQNKSTQVIELNCRRDICYAYTSDHRRANYQKFIQYLQYHLEKINTPQILSLNLSRIKLIDNIGIIKSIIMIICKEFAYNDEQTFYEVRAIVKKFDQYNMVGEEIFEQSLGLLEAPIKKRISSKLFF